MRRTEDIIDSLTNVLTGSNGLNMCDRDKRIVCESLHALVHLAKAELLLEMQIDFNALTNPPEIRADFKRRYTALP